PRLGPLPRAGAGEHSRSDRDPGRDGRGRRHVPRCRRGARHRDARRGEAAPSPRPNVGRNVAILEARQPWIAFLDSEDTWAPHKLETQWRAAQASPRLGLALATSGEVTE